MVIIVIINLQIYDIMPHVPHHHSKSFLWQALKIEEYDWYGYGETYGSEAELRTNYRYKQVWVMGV